MVKHLNLTCPINPLGYGVASLNIFLALRDQGVDIKLWPLGQVDAHPSHVPFIQEAIDTRHSYYPSAPSLRIWHQHDLAHHVGSGQHIGFPIFELDKFTEIEQDEVGAMNYIFVCSQWAKDIVLGQCPSLYHKKVIVVPLGVNRTIFHEKVGVPDPKWTTFLNIGKWEYRKGHDVLVEAFNRAFTPKDRVRLWMMNHNPFFSDQQTDEWEDMYKYSPMGDHINFLPRVQTHQEVARVMSEADCGVFPSRAEGWNLELLEMMSMGKTVITTDYSAHTEFCTSANAKLIPINTLEPAYDGVFFGDDMVGNWARFGSNQYDSLIEHMRTVHKEAKCQNTEGIETAKEFSWHNTAQRIMETDKIWG